MGVISQSEVSCDKIKLEERCASECSDDTL